MLIFIVRRLLIAVILVVIVSVISWFIMTLAPGSPIPWAEMNPEISEATKEIYKKKFHFDKPLYQQYFLMMRDLLNGKLVSVKDERPVLLKIGERLPATLALNFVSLVMAFGFGIPLGIWAARHAGRFRGTAATVGAFVAISLPTFWTSYLLCILLVKYVQIPLLGLRTFGVSHGSWVTLLLDHAWHLCAPAFVMAIGGIAVQSRYVRASLLEALSGDYIRTARAKGLRETVVFYKHALRNSLRPVVTSIGFLLPAMLGGSVIVESIFGYPGMGRLGYQSLMGRDYPVLITLNVVGAALVLVGNLLADVLYAVVDPRVRLE